VKRIALLALIALMSCQHRHADPAYRQEIEKWQANRATRLKAEDSWLSLAGLQWLNPGYNTISNPPDSGRVGVSNGVVTLVPNLAAGLQIDGKPVTAPTVLLDDSDPKGPTVVQRGSVRFNAIKRNEKYALRIKDANNPARVHFLGLDYFPINPDWRFVARFEPYPTPHKVPITNVLGMTSDETSPGELVIDVDGKPYRIQPILEQGEKDWFIIFKDATAGHETYAAARYVYASPPGPDGTTVLDFNKAYNPPCAFTPFATCPLPPPQNKLPFRIEAGEKKYRGSAH
jgi:uncharacterized protein (DUF1684 family)